MNRTADAPEQTSLQQSECPRSEQPYQTVKTANRTEDGGTHYSDGSNELNQPLDFASILQVSQTLSSVIQLDDLLRQLALVMLQHSGGDRCVLVLPNEENEWHVRAIASSPKTQTRNEFCIELCSEPIITHPQLPVELIQYVKNTQESVVIHSSSTNFPVFDPYLKQTQPQHVLCFPLLNQGDLGQGDLAQGDLEQGDLAQAECLGILYLENKQANARFNQTQVSTINLLCTQAAISLKTAKLYQQEQRKSAKLAQQAAEYQSIIQDVNAHTAAETALAENEAYHRNLFEQASIGLLLCRMDGELIYANRAFAEILGRKKEDLPALTYWEITPQKYADDEQTQLESLKKRGCYGPYEKEYIHKDGHLIPVRLSGVIVARHGEQLIWSSIEDISDRKRAEAAVLQKSCDLEHALAELQNTQLKMVQSEKMSALGGLVAGVAHEINNPVGCILGNVGALQNYIIDLLYLLDLYGKSSPNPNEELEDALEMVDLAYVRQDWPKLIRAMKDSGQRIKSISQSLRTFSRADTDSKQSFDLKEGIESTVLILRHRLNASELRPEIEVITEYGEMPDINCFPGQLNQVFMNILANAIDALDEASQGRSFVEMKANPHQITIQTKTEGNQIHITISDNGAGMTESIKNKIFDHLFTTKAVGKGTGLGLAIAHQIIVETHEGSIEVHSEPGEGTQFCIQLPL